MSDQLDEKWARDAIREMEAARENPPIVCSIGTDPPSESALAELAERVWNLYSDDPALAHVLLPKLLSHPLSAIRAGAMRGIANMAHREHDMLARHLESFRRSVTDTDPECRDAGAFGLQFSKHEEDEARLWKLLSDDSDAVVVSAAYALRDMKRDTINRKLLSQRILDKDEWPLVRLILMERHSKEPDLRETVRRAIDESRDAFCSCAYWKDLLMEIEKSVEEQPKEGSGCIS